MTGNNEYKFTPWISFNKIYEKNISSKSRSNIFIPKNEIITKPCAGIYLIADSAIGSLNSPESLIYIGKTAGENKWTNFHDRLWKHCCKSIGECGGKYMLTNGKMVKDNSDKTEPQDTKKWANYRIQDFKGFENWNFSFFILNQPDFDLAKKKISIIEDITMYAYSYYSSPEKTLCNSDSPNKSVKFPWHE
jgi:hypothetical protein